MVVAQLKIEKVVRHISRVDKNVEKIFQRGPAVTTTGFFVLLTYQKTLEIWK